MANGNFEPALRHILRHEGGFSDHPDDPGGATMMGITANTLAAWRGQPVSREDVRLLTRAEAGAIYRARYWNRVAGDALPPGLDLAMFDFAVNSGTARATRTLQGMLHVPSDGVMGPVTLGAIAPLDQAQLIRDLNRARRAFLTQLPTAPTFGRGWLRRVAAIERAALAMQAAAPPAPTATQRKQETDMSLTKSILESRTVWANLIGMASLALSIFGFPTGDLDINLITDRVLEAVAAVSFLASTVFRVVATKRIG
jgi:lysozyme family protein